MTTSHRYIFVAILTFGPAVFEASAQQAVNGRQQFISHCSACHGEDGPGGQLGPKIVDLQNPRATSARAVHDLVRSGIPSEGMPAFPKLSDAELDAIAVYVMTLKAPATSTAATTANYGDGNAGFQYFTHEGGCNRCHSIQGRGAVIGPDLGNVGRTRTAAQIEQALLNPGSLPQTSVAGRRRAGSGGRALVPPSCLPHTRRLRSNCVMAVQFAVRSRAKQPWTFS